MTYESQVISQAGQDQLDSIVAKFEEWRHQKTSRSARIPEALLHEAHKLTQQVINKHTKIASASENIMLTQPHCLSNNLCFILRVFLPDTVASWVISFCG